MSAAAEAPRDDAADQARESARRMWQDDRAAHALGIELLDVRPGYARLRMRVRDDMTNGHGIGHGGYTFLLADTTFAYACNSHGQRAVAAGAEIHFIAPTRAGELLEAEAIEQHLSGRSGVYDIRVTDPTGRVVALFRGKSATIKGRFDDPSGAGAPSLEEPPR